MNQKFGIMKRGQLLLVAAISLLGFNSVLKGDILGNVQDNQNGTYTYSYTIDNDTGFDIFAFSLHFDIPAAQLDWHQVDVSFGGAVVVPPGSAPNFETAWVAAPGVPFVGQSAQDFFAFDLFGAGDVLPGNTLGGFSFTSSFPPTQIVVSLESGPFGDSQVGTTVGPGLVAANNNPTIGLVPNQFVNKRSQLGPIPFQIDDLETPADFLTVNAFFNGGDVDVFNELAINLGGTGNNRSVFIDATTDREGSVNILLDVLDLNAGFATTSFWLDVGPLANSAPSVAPINDREVIVGNRPEGIDVLFGDVQDGNDLIEIKVTSDNQLVVRDQDILLGVGGNDRLFGNGGIDEILPGGEVLPGNLQGNDGQDRLFGSPEEDFLLGQGIAPDNIGQRQILFPELNRPGTANITVHATDPLGFETRRTFSLDVLSGEQIIIDNGDPGFFADSNWQTSGAMGQHGNDSLFAFEPGSEASYTPEFPQAGSYGVYARWASRRSNGAPFDRDRAAFYEIHHGDGTTSTVVDQRQNAGQFVLLGVFDFKADGTEKVILKRQSVLGGSTSADAVRFVAFAAGQGQGGPGDLIVDNLDDGFNTHGAWLNSNATDAYAGGSVFNNVQGTSATFTPTVTEEGKYEIYVHWAARSPNGGNYTRDSFAKYTIQHAMGSSETTVNQNVRAGQWIFLGAFEFGAGTAGHVKVSRENLDVIQATSADAVRFIKMLPPSSVDIVVDNLDAGFSAQGAWLESGTVDEFMQSSLVGFNFGDSATWIPTLPQSGNYEVYATWSSLRLNGTRFARDSRAWFEITHADGTTVTQVDQNFNAGNWVLLGTFAFNADGNERVQLFHSFLTNTGVSADAVRFVKVNSGN